jgi:hypothetical protein
MGRSCITATVLGGAVRCLAGLLHTAVTGQWLQQPAQSSCSGDSGLYAPHLILCYQLLLLLCPGEKLYIHCWGGRGRAGTVGACLLGYAYGLSAQEALERVQRAFDTRR